MKNPHILYPTIIGILVVLVLTVTFARGNSANAQEDYGVEATSWIESIKTGSAEWNAHEKNRADYQAKADAEAKDRDETGETVKGLRHSLCTRYHLLVGNDGSVTKQEVCPSF